MVKSHQRHRLYIDALLLDPFYGVQGKFSEWATADDTDWTDFGHCLTRIGSPLPSRFTPISEIDSRLLAFLIQKSFVCFVVKKLVAAATAPLSVISLQSVVKDSQGAAKPISIGAPGFSVFTITALSGRTSMTLYVRLPSAVAIGNS